MYMNKFKPIATILCGILQLFYGFALIVASFLLLIKWFFNNAFDSFLPAFFDKTTTLFGGNQLFAKLLTPILGIAIGGLILFLGFCLLKTPVGIKADNYKPKALSVFFSALLNTLLVFVVGLGLTADKTTKSFAIIATVILGIIALTQFVSVFYKGEIAKTDKNTENKTATIDDTTHKKSPATIDVNDFKLRSAELFRLAKRKNISQDDFDDCMRDLMLLPVEKPFDFKIKHLNKFTTSGMLTSAMISTLICNATVSYNTSSLKKRIRYLELARAKGLIFEHDYAHSVRLLMSDTTC